MKNKLSLKSRAFNVDNNFLVALDGPSAAGKGTIGPILAQKLKLVYYSSSIVYLNLAFLCIKKKVDISDIKAVINLSKTIQQFYDIEGDQEHIKSVASKISIIPEVRTILSKHLVELVTITPRIIMEGRDIGTVIAPSADLKIFITADLDTRAQRRHQQLLLQGNNYTFQEVMSKLLERDQRDINRGCSPLVPTKDALMINTSTLLPEEVVNKILEFINEAL